jgi:hypothetical protein
MNNRKAIPINYLKIWLENQNSIKNEEMICINKQDIYRLLDAGKTDQEISEIYPDLNPKSIPRYRAHLTMKQNGIHPGRKPSSLERKTIEGDFIDNEASILSENGIKYLLESGFSPQEIFEAYPNSFDSKK